MTIHNRIAQRLAWGIFGVLSLSATLPCQCAASGAVDSSQKNMSNLSRQSIDAINRVEKEAEENQLFQVKKSCDENCATKLEKQIRTDFDCSKARYLETINVIETNCRGHGLSQSQTGQLILASFPEKLLKHFDNAKVYLPGNEGLVSPILEQNKVKREKRRVEEVLKQEAVKRGTDQEKQNSEESIGGQKAAWGNSFLLGGRQFVSVSAESSEAVDWSTWHLDRIDQYEGYPNLDKKLDLSCFPNQGAGVTIFIIDSGCRKTHNELRGRTTLRHTDAFQSGNDDNGHGTHVAGLAAGTVSGVCKRCNIVCYKAIAANGAGTFAAVMEAINNIIERQVINRQPAVAVLSLGAEHESSVLDDAVQSLYRAGVTPVVAAANYNKDACKFTPARATGAVTVGASNIFDEIYSRSNWGSCINLFSPGEGVSSSSYAGDNKREARSGTSMAAPLVAGAIALILGERPLLEPTELTELVQMNAKQISYSKGGKVFFEKMLRVGQRECSIYPFPSKKFQRSNVISLGMRRPATPLTSPTPSPSISPRPSFTPSPSPSRSPTPSTSPFPVLLALPSPENSPSQGNRTRQNPAPIQTKRPIRQFGTVAIDLSQLEATCQKIEFEKQFNRLPRIKSSFARRLGPNSAEIEYFAQLFSTVRNVTKTDFAICVEHTTLSFGQKPLAPVNVNWIAVSQEGSLDSGREVFPNRPIYLAQICKKVSYSQISALNSASSAVLSNVEILPDDSSFSSSWISTWTQNLDRYSFELCVSEQNPASFFVSHKTPVQVAWVASQLNNREVHESIVSGRVGMPSTFGRQCVRVPFKRSLDWKYAVVADVQYKGVLALEPKYPLAATVWIENENAHGATLCYERSIGSKIRLLPGEGDVGDLTWLAAF